MTVFAKKLLSLADIDADDIELLMSASRDVRKIEAGSAIIHEGDNPDDVHVVMSGFAYRYKDTFEGRRQIFAYLLPGDFCDLHVALLKRMDHSIGTLSSCEVALMPRRAVAEMMQHPRLARALGLCSLAATLREWLLNIGQRPAEQRIAHLFCEIRARMKAVDLIEDGSFSLPIPQTALADTVGLSEVHVSRSLRALREAGLVEFQKRIVSIPNAKKLAEYAEFDPAYLHLR